jgi:adenylate cyclase
MKYAVIGDTVNVAARVEALNKTLGTTLLLTSITRDKLEPDEQMADLVPLGSHPVKGRVEALEVWTQRPGEQVEQ